MSGNIIEYVKWRGDLSFDQAPFNDVDAVVFAQLSYNKMEGLLSQDFDESITLRQLVEKLKKAPDRKKRENLGFLVNKETVSLLYECGSSIRFGEVKVSAFRSLYNEELCEQFAAATFTFGKTSVVAFRGTDDFLVGWKEDCNISYMNPIPAQKHGLEYLEQAAKTFSENKIVITGQSKGGNIAVYTGVNASDEIKERICSVYNLDGPGFPKDFFTTKEYIKMKGVIKSFYPEYDIVGKIFYRGPEYTIFKSSEKNIKQHDTMSWQVYGNKLVEAEKFTPESLIFEKSFNQWADKLSLKEKQVFIDSLFTILYAPGYKTNQELNDNFFHSSTKMLEAYAKMDKKTKRNIHHVVSDFSRAIKEEIPILKIFALSK